jgi:sulfur-carrier protein adenylyltransferase/sulfurtransferase
MTVEELKALLDSGEAPFVLDVREPPELEIAPYPFPVRHVPMRDVPQRLAEVPSDREVVVACRSGVRSENVARFLRANGVPRAVNLDGGILAWSERIDPSVPRY